ncbi:hypothetical protein CEXT_647381 [Caerostris extrusa]|uniref:UBC core domain-containing protein n=1 Tax=Caerostris extrusa TaxID=172846 RepID=A0AAV4NKE4_CAEEX|nr:hypothetical protein CEXT_647381 [Caerostris extrusa]
MICRKLTLNTCSLNMVFLRIFRFHPFMRVISPHVEKGFVMEGGAICMELLTPRGWASAYTIKLSSCNLLLVSSKAKDESLANSRMGRSSIGSQLKPHSGVWSKHTTSMDG